MIGGSRAKYGVQWQVIFSLAALLPITSTVTLAADHAKVHHTRSSHPTQASLDRAEAKLEQQQAQVKQLQDTVAKQESDSRQASDRMKQQDAAIAQMQQQLQALHDKPATGHR